MTTSRASSSSSRSPAASSRSTRTGRVLVAVDGMSCVGKTTLAAERVRDRARGRRPAGGAGGVRRLPPPARALATVPTGCRPRATCGLLRRGRRSPGSCSTRWPRVSGQVVPACLRPGRGQAGRRRPGAGRRRTRSSSSRASSCCMPSLAEHWDLAVLLVADPAVLERGVVRDADLGPPEQVRELYLRRYLGPWRCTRSGTTPGASPTWWSTVGDPARAPTCSPEAESGKAAAPRPASAPHSYSWATSTSTASASPCPTGGCCCATSRSGSATAPRSRWSGANGAGKTTLLRIVAGDLRRARGAVTRSRRARRDAPVRRQRCATRRRCATCSSRSRRPRCAPRPRRSTPPSSR